MTYPGNNPGQARGTGYVRPSIPLTPEDDVDRSASIGTLVKDATAQVSTLVRAEIELAKLEIVASAKQGAIGAVFFVVAGVIGLFSLFFFWFMVGEILDIWLPRSLAFAIVFIVMVVLAGLLALLGLRKVKKIGKPDKTIQSLQDTATTLKRAASHPDVPTKA
ncbi:MAG: phage holin family protein [Nakamurella sp.]